MRWRKEPTAQNTRREIACLIRACRWSARNIRSTGDEIRQQQGNTRCCRTSPASWSLFRTRLASAASRRECIGDGNEGGAESGRGTATDTCSEQVELSVVPFASPQLARFTVR